jgi:Ca2+-binding EF-hand superfamily protein
MLKCELQLITGKYQKRGRINIDAFMEIFESTTDKTKAVAAGSASTKDSENFGSTLFKKICKLRANDSARADFRESVINQDPDMNGYINRKKLQKILDSKLDLSESEGALLIENMFLSDRKNGSEVDYSLLLLFLCEPLRRSASAVSAGTAVVNKMMRGANSAALKRLLTLLFRAFSSADSRALGVLPFLSAEKILKEECRAVDSKHLIQVLETFQDNKSDCVQYPELLSFLSQCSLWSVLSRINHLDFIRQKQGYNFGEFLKKVTARKGGKIDSPKLTEQLLAIGILIPETGMTTIFGNLVGKGYGGGLDVKELVQRIADVDIEDTDKRPAGVDIKPYEGIAPSSLSLSPYPSLSLSSLDPTCRPSLVIHIFYYFTFTSRYFCNRFYHLIVWSYL